MKRTMFLLFTLVVAASLHGFGTDEDQVPAYVEFPEALGFQQGEVSGSGLSYHIWTPELGIQVAAGITYQSVAESYGGRTLDYTVGTEFQFPVFGEDFASWLTGQLYIFTGINHSGYIPSVLVTAGYSDGDDNWVPGVYTMGSYTPLIGTGVGIGIEVIVFRHFSFPVEVGYSLQWEPTAGALQDQFAVNLIVQAGFRYRY